MTGTTSAIGPAGLRSESLPASTLRGRAHEIARSSLLRGGAILDATPHGRLRPGRFSGRWHHGQRRTRVAWAYQDAGDQAAWWGPWRTWTVSVDWPSAYCVRALLCSDKAGP